MSIETRVRVRHVVTVSGTRIKYTVGRKRPKSACGAAIYYTLYIPGGDPLDPPFTFGRYSLQRSDRFESI